MRELFEADTADPIGKSSVDILLINTVVPYKFAWGMMHNSIRMQEEAMALLEQLPPENNSVVRPWKLLGVRPQNAADTQALIQLYTEYCIRHRCSDCSVGYSISYKL